MTANKTATTTVRALLGCALLGGVHLLGLAVLAAQLLLLVAILTTDSWQVAVPGSFTLAAVCTLGYGLLSGTSADVPEGPRIVLTAQQQPELWALIRQLADELDTAPPATLRLADTVNACAGERSRLWGLFPGPRTLDLGLPLLIGLTGDQLRAVLCHELGHYAGRHTALAAVSHRGSVALERTIRHLEVLATDQLSVTPPPRLLLRILRAYNGLYLRLTLSVRRGQELEADAAAARITGPHTLAQALLTVHNLVPLWNETTGNRARSQGSSAPAPASTTGGDDVRSLSPPSLPEGVFRDFAHRIAEPAGRPFADGRDLSALDDPSHDGLGSHPPLTVRLAALRRDDEPVDAHPASLSAHPRAASLVRNLPEAAEALQRAMSPLRGAPPGQAGQAGATVAVPPPRLDRAVVRFRVKVMLVGWFLILAASAVVHSVVSPPRTDPPPINPPPATHHVPPAAPPPPLAFPTFTLPPLPSPGRLTTSPLVPLK
ncbi:Zn-dependent protease with chaperone function [Streptomyces achromogenes]|uniref:Zn-dependent protease with chaperone function n=1 Tax=Streptomyces achromogenes TaxID=67255 RepID=A0ABU0QCX3_STRAH|nr:M48 family metallopeptidase [Streptomyces achromogenes]MDQ0688506.1 Zn-dependent protease with chaperone function [Streptomyces achromogenes]